MRELLNGIFLQNGFEVCNIDWVNLDTQTYIRENGETYIVIFSNTISISLYDEIIELCSSKINDSSSLSKTNKSNLYLLIVAKIPDNSIDDYLNTIFMIEENHLYFKKYLLWYSQEEIEALQGLLNNDYSMVQLDNMIINYGEFQRLKVKNPGYQLLTRIYIKLAFMSLSEIKVLDKDLMDYIKENCDEINNELYDAILVKNEESGFIDSLLSLVELSKKDIKEIEHLAEELKI